MAIVFGTETDMPLPLFTIQSIEVNSTCGFREIVLWNKRCHTILCDVAGELTLNGNACSTACSTCCIDEGGDDRERTM